jgi:uncharacterized protein CbrC (UPF0167 family)
MCIAAPLWSVNDDILQKLFATKNEGQKLAQIIEIIDGFSLEKPIVLEGSNSVVTRCVEEESLNQKKSTAKSGSCNKFTDSRELVSIKVIPNLGELTQNVFAKVEKAKTPEEIKDVLTQECYSPLGFVALMGVLDTRWQHHIGAFFLWGGLAGTHEIETTQETIKNIKANFEKMQSKLMESIDLYQKTAPSDTQSVEACIRKIFIDNPPPPKVFSALRYTLRSQLIPPSLIQDETRLPPLDYIQQLNCDEFQQQLDQGNWGPFDLYAFLDAALTRKAQLYSPKLNDAQAKKKAELIVNAVFERVQLLKGMPKDKNLIVNAIQGVALEVIQWMIKNGWCENMDKHDAFQYLSQAMSSLITEAPLHTKAKREIWKCFQQICKSKKIRVGGGYTIIEFAMERFFDGEFLQEVFDVIDVNAINRKDVKTLIKKLMTYLKESFEGNADPIEWQIFEKSMQFFSYYKLSGCDVAKFVKKDVPAEAIEVLRKQGWLAEANS